MLNKLEFDRIDRVLRVIEKERLTKQEKEYILNKLSESSSSDNSPQYSPGKDYSQNEKIDMNIITEPKQRTKFIKLIESGIADNIYQDYLAGYKKMLIAERHGTTIYLVARIIKEGNEARSRNENTSDEIPQSTMIPVVPPIKYNVQKISPITSPIIPIRPVIKIKN